MDILEKYKSITVNELSRSFPNHDLSNISFEFPRNSSNGDFSTNAALVLFKKLKIEFMSSAFDNESLNFLTSKPL